LHAVTQAELLQDLGHVSFGGGLADHQLAASAAPTVTHAASGTEYFHVMSTAVAPGPASVIARGVFTAAGQTRLGNAKVSAIRFRAGRLC
jgi:hypothetical protein